MLLVMRVLSIVPLTFKVRFISLICSALLTLAGGVMGSILVPPPVPLLST